MSGGKPVGDVDLEMLQRQSFSYFLNETNPDNGLVIDKTSADWPASTAGYGRNCWGNTASDGPGPDTIKVSGIGRQSFGYLGRGVPYDPDEGTIAPWAAVSSLPFAPELVLPTDVQPGLPGKLQHSWLDIAIPLRTESRTDCLDD